MTGNRVCGFVDDKLVIDFDVQARPPPTWECTRQLPMIGNMATVIVKAVNSGTAKAD